MAALASAFLAVPPAEAQSSVELRVSAREIFVNEPFLVTIAIRDFQEAEPFEFPSIPDCLVTMVGGPSESTSISIIGGVRSLSRSLSYTFELTPRKVGELLIPEIEIRVDGRALRTRSTRLHVAPSDTAELAFLEITCEPTRVYVGQRVRLSLALWLRPASTSRRVLTGREMFQSIDFQRTSLGPFPLPETFEQKSRIQADGSSATYYVYRTSSEYLLERAGPLAFDEILVAIKYPTRFGRDLFGDEVVTGERNIRLRPSAPAIEVLALPTEGRPPDFSGAVGRFTISVSAEPTTVRVGDPIELTIDIRGDGPLETLPPPDFGGAVGRFTISVSAEPTTVRVGDPIELTIDIRGDGPLETLPPPDLTAQSRLTEAFRVPGERLAGSVYRGQRRFVQTIRARRPDVTEIPPIEYPYFDPVRGEYAVARSAPLPIRVSPAETLSPADLMDKSGPPREQAEPARELDGLRGLVTDERRLLERVPEVRLAHLIVVTATPATVFAATSAYLGLVALRGRDPSRARRSRAMQLARRRIEQARRLPPAEQARAVEAALTGYLADRLDQPAGRFSGQSVLSLLEEKGVQPEVLRRWRELIEQCESLAYAGGAAAGGTAEGGAAALGEHLVDMAMACLSHLEGARL
jgi:hypothetical protein